MPKDNPVAVQALSAGAFIVVVKALIVYFRTMGWINLTDDGFQATVDVIDTVLPILAVWIGAWWASRRVTSLTDARDVDGTPLTRPDNSPPIPQVEAVEKKQEEAIKLNAEIDERRLKR